MGGYSQKNTLTAWHRNIGLQEHIYKMDERWIRRFSYWNMW